jgi:hypothetical protein
MISKGKAKLWSGLGQLGKPVDLNFQKTASVNNRGPLEFLSFYQSYLAPSQMSNTLISDIGEQNSIA